MGLCPRHWNLEVSLLMSSKYISALPILFIFLLFDSINTLFLFGYILLLLFFLSGRTYAHALQQNQWETVTCPGAKMAILGSDGISYIDLIQHRNVTLIMLLNGYCNSGCNILIPGTTNPQLLYKTQTVWSEVKTWFSEVMQPTSVGVNRCHVLWEPAYASFQTKIKLLSLKCTFL